MRSRMRPPVRDPEQLVRRPERLVRERGPLAERVLKPGLDRVLPGLRPVPKR